MDDQEAHGIGERINDDQEAHIAVTCVVDCGRRDGKTGRTAPYKTQGVR